LEPTAVACLVKPVLIVFLVKSTMTEQGSSPMPQMAGKVDLRGAALFRSSLLNLMGLVVPYLIAFLAIPFIIRWLGIERFGILSLVWVIFGYFGLFDLGLGKSTTKYIAEALGKEEHEKIPQYLWTAVFLQLAIGLVSFLLLFLCAPLLAEHVMRIPPQYITETKTTLRLVAVSLPIMFVTSSFRGVLEASQRFDFVNAVKIPVSILFYALPLIGALIGLNLPGIVILLVLSRLAGLLAWLIICLRVHPILRSRPSFHKGALHPLFSFSVWLIISGIVYTVTSSVDKFLIGSLVSLKAVSYYSGPYEAIMRLGVIPGSLSMVLFPAFSFLSAGNNQAKTEKLFARSVNYLLLSTAPIFLVLIFFARPLLRLWLGSEFAENSTIVVQVLAVGFMANALATVAFNYLQGIGRVDLTTKYQIVELFVFFSLLWLFIKLWGIKGAALASMLRFIFYMLFLFLFSFRTGHIVYSSFLKTGILKAIGVVLVYSLGLFLNGLLRSGFIGAAILTCGFLVFIYRCFLEDSERKILRAHLLFWRASSSLGA
jgi:O-antigen/teichoic acid export membrane protein